MAEHAAALVAGSPGGMDLKEVVARLEAAGQATTSAAVRRMLAAQGAFVSVWRGRYVYLPRALNGAAVFVPSGHGPLGRVLPIEAALLLWPSTQWERRGRPLSARPAHVRLPGGGEATWSRDDLVAATRLESPRHGDGLVLACVDAEAGEYTLDPCPRLSDEEVKSVVRRWREAVQPILGGRGVWMVDSTAALRLLAGGAYHAATPPATLSTLTAYAPFESDGYRMRWRDDLTPALWRLFGARFAPWHEDARADELFGTWPEEAALAAHAVSPEAARAYRLRARVAGWQGEFVADAVATLEDVHLALQEALAWDNDHLYAFYLSGEDGDAATVVPCPYLEESPPCTTEVALGAFDPRPGSTFLYVFDFGDHWRIDIDVLAREAKAGARVGVRLVQSQGRPPRQYD